jgi:6-phosphogluconolactonase
MFLSTARSFLFRRVMKSPRRVGTVLGLVTAGLTATCGAPHVHAAEGPDFWVFFGTYTGATSKGIYVSRLNASGQLSVPELAATVPNPAFLAVDPSRRFLYATSEVGTFRDEKAGFVSAFTIDAATGKIALRNEVSTITGGPCHVSVDATGKVVLVANYGGGSVQSYPVKPDGGLGAAASFIKQSGSSVNPARQKEPHAHCIGVDPANRFALLCDLGLDQVLVFKLDPDAATLTPNDPPFARTAPGAGPRHFAFRPDGKFAYVINELDCTIGAFAWNSARGELTSVQNLSTLPVGISVQPGFSTAEVVVHPSGRFLYGSNRGHDTIVVYAIDDASGEMTLVEHVASGGQKPRSFNLDPTGRFLLSANQDSGTVVVFRVDDATGRLTATGTTVAIEKPVCVAFVPVK